MRMIPLLLACSVVPACTYDESLGRTVPPMRPGHLQARWAQAVGGLGVETGETVAVAATGDVVVAGSRQNFADPPSDPPWDPVFAFVAKLDGATGAPIWDVPIDVATVGGAESIAVGANGHVLICGGIGLTAAIVELDAAGQQLWSRSLGLVPQNIQCKFGADNTAYIAGRFVGPLDVGTGPVLGDVDGDAVLLALDAAGATRWGRVFQGPGMQYMSQGIIRASGDLVFLAVTSGPASFGGDEIDPADSIFESVVVSYSSQGEHQWTRSSATNPPEAMPVRLAGIGEDRVGRLILLEIHDDPMHEIVRVLDDEGTQVTSNDYVSGQTDLHRGHYSSISPDGLIITAGLRTVRFDDFHDISEVYMAASGEDGASLGGSRFQGYGESPISTSMLVSHSLVATDAGIVLAGDLRSAVDFGSGQISAHGSVIPTEPGAWNTGADAFVVKFDWIED